MIIQTVNKNRFMNAFMNMRPENFSYEALDILFDYFDQMSEDIEQNIELDVIAICCDYSEITPEEAVEMFSLDVPEDATSEDIYEALQEVVEVIAETSNSFIINQ